MNLMTWVEWDVLKEVQVQAVLLNLETMIYSVYSGSERKSPGGRTVELIIFET